MIRLRRIITAVILLAPSLALGQAPDPFPGQPVAHPPIAGAVGSLAFPTPMPMPPATLAAGQTWTSPPIWTGVWSDVLAGATSDTTGAIRVTINRFIGSDGTQPIDSNSATATSQKWASVAIIDAIPFASYSVTITNLTGSAINLTAFSTAVQRRGHP